MNKVFFALVAVTVFVSACTTPFKKTKSGLEYKIVTAKGGKILNQGNFMELDIVELYNDSVLNSTIETASPSINLYDTAQFPPDYKEIFGKLHVGDSIIVKISTDSIEKQGGALPPFMKKGQFVYSTYKITNVYISEEEANKARTANMVKTQARREENEKKQIAKDETLIKDYLAKNNIQAVKAPKGTYVQIITLGAGASIDTSMILEANYTGKTMAGKMFDSNTDPAKGHVDPLIVNLTSDPSLGGIIEGWKDGFSMLKVGSKAKLFIPSSLAYGDQGSGQDIAPNEILVFDIDILNSLTKPQAKAKIAAMQLKFQQMQQQYTDSLKKANPAQ
jgi:FKBP-type peptidyl-prolyl cis-trans isomerase